MACSSRADSSTTKRLKERCRNDPYNSKKRGAWVDAKMRDEDADTDSRRALRDRWLERVVWAVTVLAAFGIAQGINIKAMLP